MTLCKGASSALHLAVSSHAGDKIIRLDPNSKRFFRRLAVANAVVLVLVIVLYQIGVAPNPPEIREQQIPQFIGAVALTIVSANFTVISLYFIIRFWGK